MVRWLRIAALVAVGAVFGPVLAAVLLASFAPADERDRAVGRLLREFDDRNASLVLASLHVPTKECGYDFPVLFTEEEQGILPEQGRSWEWSPYAGYFALYLYRRGAWNDRLARIRAEHLDAATSDFSARFLRECMRQTIFAGLCEKRTRALLGKWTSAHSAPPSAGDRLDSPGEDGMICAYLDGVAARRKHALAPRAK